jgi:hypothetical protein
VAIHTGDIFCSHPPFIQQGMPMCQTISARFVVAIRHPGYCYPEVLGFYFSPAQALSHYQWAKCAYSKSEVMLGMR